MSPVRSAGCRQACRLFGREWTQEQIAAAERGVVAVLYASAYGNTAALAQAISRGVTKAGELAVCFQLGSVAFVSLCVTGASAPCAEAHALCRERCDAVRWGNRSVVTLAGWQHLFVFMGLHVAGVGVETLNLEVATLDEVSDTIARSAGFVIGSPTLGGHMPTQVPSPYLGVTSYEQQVAADVIALAPVRAWRVADLDFV